MRRVTAPQDSWRNFFRPDPEGLQDVWPKGRRKRDIGRVTAASDGHASNPWHIMARVEGKPAPIQKDFEPRIIIHRSWIRRHRAEGSHQLALAMAVPVASPHNRATAYAGFAKAEAVHNGPAQAQRRVPLPGVPRPRL